LKEIRIHGHCHILSISYVRDGYSVIDCCL